VSDVTPFSSPDAPLIQTLRQRVEQTVAPLLRGHRSVALLDYPSYANVGDSAIWLGELRLLRTLGVGKPLYTADLQTCSERRLRERVGDGVILLSGGGNLGDLWLRHQHFRERILRAFPDQPIVQLPQSIFFESRAHLDDARRAFDAHRELVLLVRDERSLEIARKEFAAPSLLCPDAAFCLGSLRRRGAARHETIFLLRADKESGGGLGQTSPACPSTPWVDWNCEGPGFMPRLQRDLRNRLRRSSGAAPLLHPALAATYQPVARARLRRGLRLLSTGQRVVTDRLHGHVLSLLLGIPHVLVDDRHGKLRCFFETWTQGSALATWRSAAGRESSA